MPKGTAAGKKAGTFSGGSGFEKRPPGINYFTLKAGQKAVVRFLHTHDEIAWASKWKVPTPGFQYGELINKVDQFEDGTPDPGYAAGLKSSFKAYPLLIWRNAPVYQKDNEGKLLKDSNGNKTLVGYADQIAVWECSNAVYEILEALDAKFRGLNSRDYEVERIGGDKNTRYNILPEMDAQPFSPSDQQLLSQDHVVMKYQFDKVPTYEDLATYLNGGGVPSDSGAGQTPQQQFQQTTNTNQSGGDGPNPFM